MTAGVVVQSVTVGSVVPDHEPGSERFLPLYYGELRQIARRVLGRNDRRLTIQPTELVHQALLRLLASPGVAIENEHHFLALGARIIRMTLIDEIRRRKAAKRDGEVVTLWPDHADAPDQLDIESLDLLLGHLADFEPVGARIVELRFFVGMTMEEIARILGLSESTTLRRWRLARAWLFKELQAAA